MTLKITQGHQQSAECISVVEMVMSYLADAGVERVDVADTQILQSTRRRLEAAAQRPCTSTKQRLTSFRHLAVTTLPQLL